MAVSTIDPNGLNIGQIGGRRNILINSDFRISQRSTSVTGVSTNGYKTVDRWNYNKDVSGCVLTMSQDTDAPDGFVNSFKLLVTTTGTPASTNQNRIEQRIESQNVQQLKYGTASAQQLTVSFWVKTNKTGNWSVGLYMDGSGYTISQAYTVNSADTWEYKTVTFAANTAQAMTGNFRLWFTHAAGTDCTSGSSNTWSTDVTHRAVGQSVNLLDTINNYWQITGVQLELGDVPTPFEHRSYGEELNLCKRYYEHSYTDGVVPGTTTDSGMNTQVANEYVGYLYGNNVYFDVQKRTTPTMKFYSRYGVADQWQRGRAGVAEQVGGNPIASSTGSRTISLYMNTTGSVSGDNSFYGHWTADAEL